MSLIGIGQYLQGQQGFGSQIPSGYGGFSMNPQGGGGNPYQGFQKTFDLNPQGGFQLGQGMAQEPATADIATGNQGGLLGMAMKKMGVEDVQGTMGQLRDTLMSGANASQNQYQPSYTSHVQSAASYMPQGFQNQTPGGFY